MHEIQTFLVRRRLAECFSLGTYISVILRVFCYLVLLLFISLINTSTAQWWPHELPAADNWRAVDRVGNGIIRKVFYSPNYHGQVYLAVVTSIGVELHSNTNRRLFFPGKAPIKAFGFHPTEKLFATIDKDEGDENYVVKLWEITNPQNYLAKHGLGEQELKDVSLEFSDDGKWLAVGHSKEIIVWKFDPEGHKVKAVSYPKPQPVVPISSICFGTTRGGKIYLAASVHLSSAEEKGNEIWVWTLSESQDFVKTGVIETKATEKILSIASNRSGYLAIGTEDENVNLELWEISPEDAEEGKLSNFIKDWSLTNPPVYQAVFHPHKSILGAITKSGGIIYQIDKDASLPLEDGQLSLSFSPDDNLLAFIDDGYSVKKWDWQKQDEISEISGYTKSIKTFDVVDDNYGKIVVAATKEGIADKEENDIIVWKNRAFGSSVQQWELEEKIFYSPSESLAPVSVNFLSITKNLVAIASEDYGDGQTVDIRNLENLSLSEISPEGSEHLRTDAIESKAVSFNFQGNWLVIGSTGDKKGLVIKFNLDNETATILQTDDNDAVTSIDFAPDDEKFAAGTRNDKQKSGGLWLWTKDLKSVVNNLSPVVDIAFVSDNKVAVAMENQVKIINIDAPFSVEPEISSEEFESEIRSVDYSYTDKKLFVATGNQIKVWNYKPDEFQYRYKLEGHTDLVTRVIWDGQNVVSSSRDGTILFWEIEVEKEEQPLKVKIVKPQKEDYVLPQFEVELDFGQEVLLDSVRDIVEINGTVAQIDNLRLGESSGRVILKLNLEGIDKEIKKNKAMTLGVNTKPVDTLYGTSSIEAIEPEEVEFRIGVGVWPGDTNDDGTVDVLDVLPLGLFYKQSPEEGLGGPRTDASDEWKAQPAKPWDSDTDYDRASADANGDGIINENDLLPVAKNWSKSRKIAQSPMIHTDLAETEFEVKPEMMEIYRRMYSVLEEYAAKVYHETEGVIALKKAISQIIAKLQKRFLPQWTKLLQNFPNPFNPETWIPYQLAEPADVTVEIYDLTGHLVRTLELGHKPAGFYVEKGKAGYWDGRNEFGERVASGLYFYRLSAGSFSAQKRLVILK